MSILISGSDSGGSSSDSPYKSSSPSFPMTHREGGRSNSGFGKDGGELHRETRGGTDMLE